MTTNWVAVVFTSGKRDSTFRQSNEHSIQNLRYEKEEKRYECGVKLKPRWKFRCA